MHFNSAHKLIFTSIVSFVVVGILAVTFWRVFSDVRDAAGDLSLIESRIADLENDHRTALAVSEVLKEKSSDLERIGRFLIDRERPVGFIEDLERLAEFTGNKVAIDVVSSEKGRSPDILNFRLTIEGEEKDVFRYLRLLELAPYEISVEDFAYQKIAPSVTPAKSAKSVSDARFIILIGVKTKT